MKDKGEVDKTWSNGLGASGPSEIVNEICKENSDNSKNKSESKSINDNGALRKDNPNSFQARLERGLRSLSNKTAVYRRGKSKTPSTSKQSTLFKTTDVDGNLPIEERENNGSVPAPMKTKKDYIGDTMRVKSSSQSMRQLFSMAESWSSDSIASHSDSCTCCEADKSNRRRPPCPVHGASTSFEKKNN